MQQKESHTSQVFSQMSTSVVLRQLQEQETLLDLEIYQYSVVPQKQEQLLTRTSQSSTSSVKSNLLSPRHMLAKQKSRFLEQQKNPSSEHLTLVKSKSVLLEQHPKVQHSIHQKKEQKSEPLVKLRFYVPSDTKDLALSVFAAMQLLVFASESLVLVEQDYLDKQEFKLSCHINQMFISFWKVAQALQEFRYLHQEPTDGLSNGINKTGILN